MPWALKPSIKPAGVLPNSKWVFNGQAPNSGITKLNLLLKVGVILDGLIIPQQINEERSATIP